MSEEKLLTIREVSLILGITEKEVIDLAEKQIIPAYRIGGVYVRFKNQQVEDYRKKQKLAVPKEKRKEDYPFRDKVSDFFYYNDFYILSSLIILIIVVIILRGY